MINEKGYFKSTKLARITNRSIGPCRNLITKFEKFGFIECIELPSGRSQSPQNMWLNENYF